MLKAPLELLTHTETHPPPGAVDAPLRLLVMHCWACWSSPWDCSWAVPLEVNSTVSVTQMDPRISKCLILWAEASDAWAAELHAQHWLAHYEVKAVSGIVCKNSLSCKLADWENPLNSPWPSWPTEDGAGMVQLHSGRGGRVILLPHWDWASFCLRGAPYAVTPRRTNKIDVLEIFFICFWIVIVETVYIAPLLLFLVTFTI